MDIRRNFTKRDLRYWNRFPREVVESPFLEVFKRHKHVVLRDVPYHPAWLLDNDLTQSFKGLFQLKHDHPDCKASVEALGMI